MAPLDATKTASISRTGAVLEALVQSGLLKDEVIVADTRKLAEDIVRLATSVPGTTGPSVTVSRAAMRYLVNASAREVRDKARFVIDPLAGSDVVQAVRRVEAEAGEKFLDR